MDLRLAALNGLLQMDAERAMPILRKVLERRDACSVELRRKAVFLVSQHAGGDALQLLLDVARTDPEVEVQRQAVFWIGQMPGDAAVAALDSILMLSDGTALRERAIFALAQHHSARAEEILRNYAVNGAEPVELRDKAIFWLGSEGGADAGRFLMDLYDRLDSGQLKEKVLFSVSQHASRENREWLLGVAGNASESIELRKKAVFWLSQQDMMDMAGLRALYASADDRELREQVLFALSQRHEQASVDELMTIAREESDPELRKKALFWLGQSQDPRVADFLLEMIEK